MDSLEMHLESPRKRQKVSTAGEENVQRHQPLAEQDALLHKVQDKTEESATPAALHPTHLMNEEEVGITEYVSAKGLRFSGTLKKRYTDFLVNEILPSGEVLHLTDLGTHPKPQRTEDVQNTKGAHPAPPESTSGEASHDTQTSPSATLPVMGESENASTVPAQNAGDQTPESGSKAETHQISAEDEAELLSYFGPTVTSSMIALYQKVRQLSSTKARTFGAIRSLPLSDRELRTTVHKAVRRIFQSRLETTTDDDGAILITASSSSGRARNGGGHSDQQSNRPKGRVGWQELGGEFLYFTIYKENKDTMEVISFLAHKLRIGIKAFQFAGTKDRRGVTVQRASGYRVPADRLIGLNRILRGAKIGGLAYMPAGLGLGDLSGNEFVITLRDCSFPALDDLPISERIKSTSERIAEAVRDFTEHGYINYYGLQRFGTFAARTDRIGMKMLKGDFKGACDDILSYNSDTLAAIQDPGNALALSSDDVARVKAVHLFKTTGNVRQALKDMPKKFSAETALIRYLGNPENTNNYLGALQTIPRNLRMMYVHAYQSLVWNMMAGERWKCLGDKVVEGDLILIDKADEANRVDEADEGVDESGEVVVLPGMEDSCIRPEDSYQRARRLSKEEAESGRYTIFDVVLPGPGYDVIYPGNCLENSYKDFMASERGGGLDPYNMRRKWRDVSLSGSYRKFLARPLDSCPVSFEVRSYTSDYAQMVETDLQRIEKKRQPVNDIHEETEGNGAKPGEGDAGNEHTKIAVILKLQLGTSQYATMALRELMGPGGVQTYKPDFGGGR